jgi:hypothetical protein
MINHFTAYLWWEMAKILYFIGLNIENSYGRNTIGNTAYNALAIYRTSL